MKNPDRYKGNYGNEGRVSYPYVRVSVGGDGWLEIVVCRNKREYRGPGSPERMFIPPSAAEKLRDALLAAVPNARREEAARQKRGQRHNKRHTPPDPNCILCRVRSLPRCTRPDAAPAV